MLGAIPRGNTAKNNIRVTQRCISGDGQFCINARRTICECGNGLEFVIEGDVDFLGSITERDDMWRYKKLMPVKPEHIVTAGEGNSPIIHLAGLSRMLHIELYAKIESANPTGTFKDREASFVVSRSLDVGDNNLVLQSTGNTAMSVTYYSGLAGLASFVFIPLVSKYKLSIPEKKEANKIILVDGTPLEVKKYAEAFAGQYGFPKVSPFHERCECNVTQAYEVYEEVLREKIPPPDFYVQVISAGMGPIGFYLGAKRMMNWCPGKVKMPRIVCVQNSEFAPMNDALLQGKDELGEEGKTPAYPVGKPFEPTLHTTNAPAYYPYVKLAIEDSDGLFPVIDPETTMRHEVGLHTALRNEGYGLGKTENASLIGYAGLVELVEAGKIPRGSNVLLMITGKGDHVTNCVEPDAVIKPDYDVSRLYRELSANRGVIHNEP